MYRMHPCWHRHGCCGVVWVDDGWLTCTQPAPFHTFVKESLSLWDDVHSLNRPFIYKFTQSLSFDTLIHWYCIYTSYSQYDNMGICSIYTLPIRCFVGNFPRNTLPPWKTDLSTGGTAKERDHLLKNTFERWAGKPVDFSRRVPGLRSVSTTWHRKVMSRSLTENGMRCFFLDLWCKTKTFLYSWSISCRCAASQKPFWSLTSSSWFVKIQVFRECMWVLGGVFHFMGVSLVRAFRKWWKIRSWEFDSVTPQKKRTCPVKRDYFSREYIFQPLIFRGHSFVFWGLNGSMVPSFVSRWYHLQGMKLDEESAKVKQFGLRLSHAWHFRQKHHTQPSG